ncbi:MAG: NAD-dependent epimerase/dehydratase family protein [Pseudomonadota bacterium]
MIRKTKTGPLIMGASGQIGQMLYRLWDSGQLAFDGDPVWQVRRPLHGQKQTLIWDILAAPVPDILPSAVICLAGGRHVNTNVELAEAAAAVAQGAPLLYASSQAVYGPQPGVMSEASLCRPAGNYGIQKRAAEAALTAYPNATALRIGNAIGADSLLRSAQKGTVALDQFDDEQGPRRMMIGPLALGRALCDLIAVGPIVEPVLNFAQPGLVAMADLLDAAGAIWHWQPAPESAIPSLEMDLAALQTYIPLSPADPETLMAEARAAGWKEFA